jgi:hypothetical protein
MPSNRINRREFVSRTAGVAGALATGGLSLAEASLTQKPQPPARRSILNFNEQMDYRSLGKTGLMVSAVCLGGHWKRVEVMLGRPFKGVGYIKDDYDNVNSPRGRQSLHRGRDQLYRRLRRPRGAGLQQGAQGTPQADVPGLLLVRT